jgi:hypothetical protein
MKEELRRMKRGEIAETGIVRGGFGMLISFTRTVARSIVSIDEHST